MCNLEQSKLFHELLNSKENHYEITPEAANWLIENYQKLSQSLPRHSSIFKSFYFQEDAIYTGIDNDTGDAFVESFLTLEGVKAWLDGKDFSEAKDYDLECALKEFEDVPFDEIDKELYLAVDWKVFKVGTSRSDIWEYFDTHYSQGIHSLLEGKVFMEFEDMKKSLSYLMKEDYREFLKAIISIESGVDHELSLDTVVDNFMETDKTTFMIEELVDIETDAVLELSEDMGLEISSVYRNDESFDYTFEYENKLIDIQADFSYPQPIYFIEVSTENDDFEPYFSKDTSDLKELKKYINYVKSGLNLPLEKELEI